jgi:hypothetical protein
MRNPLGVTLVLATLGVATLALVGCQAPPDVPVEQRPLYKLTERQTGDAIASLQATQPDLRERLVTLARRNVGQPYDIYLLGEAPFERIDPQPVYNLRKSDCVVFTEHMLAMSLSDNFPQFMGVLQRIRYKDGQIGCVTRNHYTEADWNKNNGWLLREITAEVDPQAPTYPIKVDRAKFFQKTFKLKTDLAVEQLQEPFVPYAHMPEVRGKLRTGDIVNFVKGNGPQSAWVHHLGIVEVRDGIVWVIHSAEPRVVREPIDAFIARAVDAREKLIAKKKPYGLGFKFHRLHDDPWANLRAIDGPDAPRVTVPETSPITWPDYVKSIAP